MNHPRARHLPLAAAAALLLAGCQDPYQREQAQTAPGPPPARIAGDTGRPGPRAAALSALPKSTSSGARTAARTFARVWIDWDWRTFPSQQMHLASLSVGRLAAGLRANAKASAADATLPRDRPSARGSVIAVDARTRGRRVVAVVVTREQSYTAGRADLGGQRHRVYRALLTRQAHGWKVAAWTPLP